MVATHQHPFIQPISRSQGFLPSGLLFPSRSSSMDADTIQMSFMDLAKSHKAAQAFDYDSPPRGMSPLPKLKPLPNPHYLSGGVSELSELFKTTSIDDGFAYTSPTAPRSPSNGPDSQRDSITAAPRPINLPHLSKGRLSSGETTPFFSFASSSHPGPSYNTKAHLHSPKFPRTHRLNLHFVELYQLEDELGAGGYGFVMTARQRHSGREVAVKFIIKEKVPEHAWMEDKLLGRLPTEIALLNTINHKNVVKFLDLFEDNIYFYLVQELHGSPWENCEENIREIDSLVSTPSLSPSASERSLDSSEPTTPPPTTSPHFINPDTHTSTNSDPSCTKQTSSLFQFKRPEFTRRASHDLFECIEQSEEKRLPETQSRHVFAQVVDVVHHLDSLGIAHRDIKDENLVIDKSLKVKLIDFGSACAVDPTKPRPYYTQFFGTAAYASAEILQKKKYQAAPAEIWTLGVLLSYLLTGTSPFPSMRDAIEGKVTITDVPDDGLPEEAVDLMHRCLDPNPETRITIQQVREHPWLKSSTSPPL